MMVDSVEEQTILGRSDFQFWIINSLKETVNKLELNATFVQGEFLFFHSKTTLITENK